MKKEWTVPSITKISVKRETKSGGTEKIEDNNASHSHAQPQPHVIYN